LDGHVFYEALEKRGNEWGPCFRGMEQVWCGEREALGRIRVAASLVAQTQRYRFHPAVSDSCGHVLVATMPTERDDGATGGAFVGGGVGEVRFHRSPVGEVLWARARLRPPADDAGNVVIGDVEVFDESGALVSETREARLWYLDESSEAAAQVPDNWYHHVVWEKRSLGERSARAAASGPWLIFADSGGIAQQIAATRKAAGLATVLVERGERWSRADDRVTMRPDAAEDYVRLFEEVAPPAAILHLWSTDEDRSTVDADAVTGAESLLHLLHGVKNCTVHPRIWLVTRDTQAVVDADACEGFRHAALWGAGKAFSVEHAELWGGLIDLAGDLAPTDAARHVLCEVTDADGEDKIAFRAGARYVPRLAQCEARERPVEEIIARPDVAYLITGGLGGLGLAMARWLVDRGARHLLLLGRTPMPARASWASLDPASVAGRRAAAIAELEMLGATVEAPPIDVGDEHALSAYLASRHQDSKPPVRGVIHAAGTLQFEALATQSLSAFRSEQHAKAKGALALHRLLGKQQLDFFVFCSSSSALLNSPLLGGYAAANAVLDALAHHRRAQGLPALSINWGTWGEAGMAVEAGRGGRNDMLKGAATISTVRGLSALNELLLGGDVQTAVMPMSWSEFAHAYPHFATDPFLDQLVEKVGREPAGAAAAGLSRARLIEASSETWPVLITDYLRTEAARVLGADPERFDTASPLSAWGFDSLMAVQLKNRIETDLGVVVPMIDFLQGPSVEQLVPSVCAAVKSHSPAIQAAEDVEVWEEGSL
jgi:NAD(P)-dependent dehydrogenase (short-subunit alcohol dehydrogenase family)/acyl carrier protein